MAGLWTPTWQANHAYLATAVVIPTTFTEYTWRCTTAGTSAGTEPTWPVDPSVTPTVTDGSVVWTVGTGFRQAIQAGIVSMLTSFIAANPTIIRTVRTVRPRSFTTADLPVFYVGDLNETIASSPGVRTRTVTGFSCYLVDSMGEQQESNDRMNFAVDALTDLFTENPHIISGRSLFKHTATIDTEEADGPTIFPAVEFQFAEAVVQEGRN